MILSLVSRVGIVRTTQAIQVCKSYKMSAPKPTVKQKADQGPNSYLTLACYLWVVFALFVLYRCVILSEHDIPFAPHGFALVNALVLAKVILVAQGFVREWLSALELPLICTIPFESAILRFS